jgi:hypothetical protein
MGDVNYNLRSPLNAQPDFFTFPCKGFGIGSATTFYDNNEITITLEGTAVHGGGHCQFGISYDNKEFIVLKTVESTCLLDTMTYTFNLPDDARKGDMVVFWTWINKIGNREYYMECADVNVKGDSTKSVVIKGKELLVVNLPGYPTVAEGSMQEIGYQYGLDLLNARKDKYLEIGNTNTLPTLPTLPIPKPIDQNQTFIPKYKDNQNNNNNNKKSYRRRENKQDCDDDVDKQENEIKLPKEKVIENECITGKMRCSGSGFETCVFNNWIYRDCAIGTSCNENGDSIMCI